MPSIKHPCPKMTAIFLSACSLGACAVPVTIDADCAWSKQIKFSQETKTWLVDRIPWPVPLRDDLMKIARHNDKFETFCE